PTKAMLPPITIPAIMLVIILIFFVLLTIFFRKLMVQFVESRDRAEGATQRLGETSLMLLANQQDAGAILQAIADPIVALDRGGFLVGMNGVAIRALGFVGDEIKKGERIHVSEILRPLDEGFEDATDALPVMMREGTMDITETGLDAGPLIPPTPGR